MLLLPGRYLKLSAVHGLASGGLEWGWLHDLIQDSVEEVLALPKR